MAEYFLYTRCEDVDPPATPIIPPKQPSGGLPAGGEPGQVLTIDDDGDPIWAPGGGGGIILYNTTGQSTTGGMTQKAITDALNKKQNELVAGSNITLTPNLDGTTTISSTGGGGGSLSAELDVSESVGGIKDGDNYPPNTPIEDLLRDMLSPTKNPTLTPPSASITGSIPTMAKVGETVPGMNVSVVLNRGSISPQYTAAEPYRAGAASGYAITMSGSTADFSNNNTSGTFSIPSFTKNSKGNVTITGTVNHGQGTQPKNSIGENYSTPLPAGSVSTTKTIQFVIPFKYGVAGDKENIDLDLLTDDVTGKANKEYLISTNNQHVVFAYDSDHGNLSSILDQNGFETISGWEKKIIGLYTVYVQTGKTTDTAAKYTFRF